VVAQQAAGDRGEVGAWFADGGQRLGFLQHAHEGVVRQIGCAVAALQAPPPQRHQPAAGLPGGGQD